jgi:hypothetical protein
MSTFTDDIYAAIHKGLAYTYTAEFDLDPGESLVLLGAPGAEDVHFHDMSFDGSGGPIRIEFLRNPTVSDYGSLAEAKNRKMSSSRKSSMKIYTGATLSADGEELFSKTIYVDTAVGVLKSQSGSGVLTGSWLLDVYGDVYAVRITSGVEPLGDTISISGDMFFLEKEVL